MSDSMRGLFFIMKGQYSRDVGPSFVNEANGNTHHVGGYDPSSDDTVEWYMVLDNVRFSYVYGGSDYNKCLESIKKVIKRHKGSAKKYLEHIKGYDNIYPLVSPVMVEVYKHVYEEYGQFFREDVERVEDIAYQDLEEWIRENKPINKTKKRLGKSKLLKRGNEETSQKRTNEVLDTPKKLVKPKRQLGVKKIGVRHS